ncbi:hypothetical protein RyT2_24160 [Pseudolactococcus yaeyamensis]
MANKIQFVLVLLLIENVRVEQWFVNKILGNYEERYFGGGHKRTDYSKIHNLVEKDGEYLGYVSLHQRDGWSKKKEINVTPHLSTFDGVVISALLLERYFEKFYPKVSLNSLCIDSFEIKAGATPIEDLNRIPITLKKITQDNDKYWARIEILSMKLKISLTQYLLENDCLTENIEDKYFSKHLKNIRHDLTNIDFLTEKYANCDVVRDVLFHERYSGMSSSCYFNISILEWLIIVSQFAQVMVYNFDGMARCDSDTLWMRTVKAKITTPLTYIEPIMLTGEIVKSSTLKRGDDEWRILEMQGSTIGDEVIFSGNVAHRLPNS